MKTMHWRLSVGCVLWAVLAGGPVAWGYYDPAVQRWINRDPIAEPGFRGEVASPGAHHRGSGKVARRHSRSLRDPGVAKPLYVFAVNDPVSNVDALGLDRPGCDGIPSASESPCALEACARHDKCYHDYGCTALSWLELLEPVITPCKRCNCTVLADLIACAIWDEGYDDETAPNYYCGLHDVFFDDPDSPHMAHKW